MKRSLLFFYLLIIILVGGIRINAYDLIDLEKEDGSGYVTYRGTNIRVQIPDVYEAKERDFRGVWISTMTGDIARFASISQYKEEINSVFEVMDYYRLNTMIFHIRIYNDALYDSSLNKRSPYYSTVKFSEWDPLAWIIEECHKRGIEFHAWMNPYRVLSSGAPNDLADYAATEPSYNIASNPDNLLKAGSGIILNPAKPEVRDFIIQTCLEVVEKYDVDAIHFDDYFYANGIDDYQSRLEYNVEGLSVANFRRKQVDLFIEQLSLAIRTFNIENGRIVQFGISPTGIYRNSSYNANYSYDDNGNLITPIGSNTAGQEHYESYLYSDTKKWIDNEWIDYILPQTYWSFERDIACYAAIMDWWDAVVKNKNVNLYSGMGLYRVYDSGDWHYLKEEAIDELKYGSKLSNVLGHSIYSYKHLRMAHAGEQHNYYYQENFDRVKKQAWIRKAIPPEIRTYNPIVLPSISRVEIIETSATNTLIFENNSQAKFYIIYKSTSPIRYLEDEVYDIIGNNKDEVVYYIDNNPGSYFYGVRVMSKTNTLNEGKYADSEFCFVTFKNEDGSIIDIQAVMPGTSVIPPIVNKEGYDFIDWDKDISVINNDIEVTPIFRKKTLTVTFLDSDGRIINSSIIPYGGDAVLPEVDNPSFIGWDLPHTNITTDMVITAVYQESYKITFYINDEIYIEKWLIANNDFEIPDIPLRQGYDKTSPTWSIEDYSNITEDTSVYAIYTINVYVVTFLGQDEVVLKEEEVEYGSSATAPEVPKKVGQKFKAWDKEYTNITEDLIIRAEYEKEKTSFSCKSFSIVKAISFIGSIVVILFLRRRIK